MNPITEMFESLTDIEVKQAIKEIKEDGEEGIVTSGGMVRKMAENMSTINKLKVSDNLFSAEILLLKQGAFRFIR
jgi:methanogenic corrinoid protein MtbC1